MLEHVQKFIEKELERTEIDKKIVSVSTYRNLLFNCITPSSLVTRLQAVEGLLNVLAPYSDTTPLLHAVFADGLAIDIKQGTLFLITS